LHDTLPKLKKFVTVNFGTFCELLCVALATLNESAGQFRRIIESDNQRELEENPIFRNVQIHFSVTMMMTKTLRTPSVQARLAKISPRRTEKFKPLLVRRLEQKKIY
jgi:hypothetical protein